MVSICLPQTVSNYLGLLFDVFVFSTMEHREKVIRPMRQMTRALVAMADALYAGDGAA